PERRGVVCAASYEARKFGVRSAMPSSTAGRLCPKGIFIPPRIGFYREESREIMKIVHGSGGVIEQMSIDEAYIEMTERFGEASEVEQDGLLEASVPMAREIKDRIRAERRLTATIGIAANKFLAKMASDLQKP